MANKLILKSSLPPGDIVMLTAAVRDLHQNYPGRFVTDVRTSCSELWANNPFITPLEDISSAEDIECRCPLIEQADSIPCHFLQGFVEFLNQRLGLRIQLTEFRGDIHLSEDERSSPSPVAEYFDRCEPYWLIVSGGKRDYTIKWWDAARYQQVVDHFRGRIQFVQVGGPGDFHPELEGVLDLRGRTNLRQLIRLVYHADGVVCPVTFLMHLAAAVPTKLAHRLRPCVVIAGGREPPHWEAYPGQQFLHTVGLLPCCRTGGCWRSRTKPLRDGSHLNRREHLCVDVVGNLPRCMDMITASDVIRKIEIYLDSQKHFERLVQAERRKMGLGNETSDHVDHINHPLVSRFSPKDIRFSEEDLIVGYYRQARAVRKQPLVQDLTELALTNTSRGLGDTLLLTRLPWAGAKQHKPRYIASESAFFEPLVKFNPFYQPAGNRERIAADTLQLRYDLGNGHFIQRLQRAFGLEPDLLPCGYLEVPRRTRPGRTILHFDPGSPHAAWQRVFVHPRARQLYPASKRIIQRFIDGHPEMTFYQVGKVRASLENVEDRTGLPLDQTIELMSQCEYFIGIISGPMHLATALGLKCIVILNFPHASNIFLPALKDVDVIESEWLYPQNVHLHQDNEGPLVKRLTPVNLEKALQGEIYPYWSRAYLGLIHDSG